MAEQQRFARDPVCGASVDKLRAPAMAIHAGKTLYFCGEDCKAKYLGLKSLSARQAPAPARPKAPPKPAVSARPKAPPKPAVPARPQAPSAPVVPVRRKSPTRPRLAFVARLPRVRKPREPSPAPKPGAAPPPERKSTPEPVQPQPERAAEPEVEAVAALPLEVEVAAEPREAEPQPPVEPQLVELAEAPEPEPVELAEQLEAPEPQPPVEPQLVELAEAPEPQLMELGCFIGPSERREAPRGPELADEPELIAEPEQARTRTTFAEIFEAEFREEAAEEDRPTRPRTPAAWPVPEPGPGTEPETRAWGRRHRRGQRTGAAAEEELVIEAELPPIEHALLVGTLDDPAARAAAAPVPAAEAPEPRVELAVAPPLEAPVTKRPAEAAEEVPETPPAAEAPEVQVEVSGATVMEQEEAEAAGALEPTEPSIQHLVLEVSGMSCPSCALQVERAIQRVPGVISCSASVALGWAVVEVDMDEACWELPQVSPESVAATIIKEVRRIGFTANLRRELARRRRTLAERWLFVRFGLAAVALAILAAMGLGQPHTITMVLLGLAVLLGSGLPLLADAVGRAWHLSVNCNTLTFLGAVGAYVLGIREVVHGGEARHAALLFEASAAVVTFALLTQLLQRRSYDQLRIGVQRVLRTRPELVERVFEAQVTKGQGQIMMDALVRVGLPATAVFVFLVVFLRAGLGLDLLGVVIPAVALIAAAAPHAVGVSVATASMAGLLRAAERKILFRDVENMEMLAEMTALVTTKSVVAQGTPRVQEAVFFAGNKRDILAMVAAAEAGSVQPAGRALYDYAVAQGIRPAPIEEVEFLHGYGLAARIGKRRVVIGSRALMEREEIDMSPAASAEAKVAASARTVAFVAVDHELAGMFALADRARPGIAQIVAALRRLGIRTTLLTGDPPRAAQTMAREAGMEAVLAEIPPDQRALELTDSRGPDEVLAVGGHPEKDGDLLQVGDVSIGVTEAPIPRVAAGVWLTRGTFADLLPAIEVARHARVVSRQNAALAVVWTAVMMALAALGILGNHGPCIAGGASALLSSVLAASTRRLLGRQPKAVR